MATGLPIPDPPVGIVAALADLSGAAVVAWDLGGRCIVWSAAAAALFGRSESAALGRPMRELIPLDDRSAVDECVVMTLAGESVPPHEKEFTDAFGRRRYFRGRCRAVRDAGGAPLGGVSLIEEFTPVAAVERAFRESETLRRSIFDVSMDAKFVIDDAGSFTDCNPAAAALLGLPRDSILGLSIWSFDGASDEIRDEWARLRRVGAIHGLRRTTLPDGVILDLAYSAKANVQEGRHLVVVRDLTEILAMRRAREESDARFRALFDCMPDATVVIRIVGEELTLLDWNETMEGIARSRLSRGGSVDELLRNHPTLLAEVRRCARDHTTLAREVAVPARSSDSAYVLRLQHRFVAPNLMILVCEDVTEARRADGERTALLAAERAARIAAEEADARSQRLAHQLTTLQEDEFRRLARELHDEFGQELTALRVLLEVCAASESPRHEMIVESERRVAGLLARVRALSHSLRPPVLDDLGLVEAVAWNVRRVGATTGLRVVFHPSNVERRFAPELELAAYRVVQEALTNVVRHAAAEAAEVRVWTVDETLFVEIRDAGSGFDSERTFQLGTSLGLAGMRERVESLRGTLVVESSVGQGTVVTAALPLAEGSIA